MQTDVNNWRACLKRREEVKHYQTDDSKLLHTEKVEELEHSTKREPEVKYLTVDATSEQPHIKEGENIIGESHFQSEGDSNKGSRQLKLSFLGPVSLHETGLKRKREEEEEDQQPFSREQQQRQVPPENCASNALSRLVRSYNNRGSRTSSLVLLPTLYSSRAQHRHDGKDRDDKNRDDKNRDDIDEDKDKDDGRDRDDDKDRDDGNDDSRTTSIFSEFKNYQLTLSDPANVEDREASNSKKEQDSHNSVVSGQRLGEEAVPNPGDCGFFNETESVTEKNMVVSPLDMLSSLMSRRDNHEEDDFVLPEEGLEVSSSFTEDGDGDGDGGLEGDGGTGGRRSAVSPTQVDRWKQHQEDTRRQFMRDVVMREKTGRDGDVRDAVMREKIGRDGDAIRGDGSSDVIMSSSLRPGSSGACEDQQQVVRSIVGGTAAMAVGDGGGFTKLKTESKAASPPSRGITDIKWTSGSSSSNTTVSSSGGLIRQLTSSRANPFSAWQNLPPLAHNEGEFLIENFANSKKGAFYSDVVNGDINKKGDFRFRVLVRCSSDNDVLSAFLEVVLPNSLRRLQDTVFYDDGLITDWAKPSETIDENVAKIVMSHPSYHGDDRISSENHPSSVIGCPTYQYCGDISYYIALISYKDWRDSKHMEDRWRFTHTESDRGWSTFVKGDQLRREFMSPEGSILLRFGACQRGLEYDPSTLLDTVIRCRSPSSQTVTTSPSEGGGGDNSVAPSTNGPPPPLPPPSLIPKYSGLRNHGATCYLNSLLQGLYHIGAFRSAIFEMTQVEDAKFFEEEKKLMTEKAKAQVRKHSKALLTEANLSFDETYLEPLLLEGEHTDRDIIDAMAYVMSIAEKDNDWTSEEVERALALEGGSGVSSRLIGSSSMSGPHLGGGDIDMTTGSGGTIGESSSVGSSDVGKALQQVFYQLSHSKAHEPVECRELIKSFGWDPREAFTQHDAQELNRILSDKLEGLMKMNKRTEGKIAELFGGETEMFIECIDVKYRSSRLESFYDIQVDVHRVSDLIESLRRYVSPETLDGDNKYEAEGFGKQRARKGVKFTKFPPILQFHLKRFHFELNRMEMVKLNDRFEFPILLNLDFLLPNAGNYNLFAVVVHQGDIDSGHYFSYVRLGAKGQFWIRFDDDFVSFVDEFQAVHMNMGGPEDPPEYWSRRFERQAREMTRTVHSRERGGGSRLDLEITLDHGGAGGPDNNKSHDPRGNIAIMDNLDRCQNKFYSAYILFYAKEGMENELLRCMSPIELNPGMVWRLQKGILQDRINEKIKREILQSIEINIVTELGLIKQQLNDQKCPFGALWESLEDLPVTKTMKLDKAMTSLNFRDMISDMIIRKELKLEGEDDNTETPSNLDSLLKDPAMRNNLGIWYFDYFERKLLNNNGTGSTIDNIVKQNGYWSRNDEKADAGLCLWDLEFVRSNEGTRHESCATLESNWEFTTEKRKQARLFLLIHYVPKLADDIGVIGTSGERCKQVQMRLQDHTLTPVKLFDPSVMMTHPQKLVFIGFAHNTLAETAAKLKTKIQTCLIRQEYQRQAVNLMIARREMIKRVLPTTSLIPAYLDALSVDPRLPISNEIIHGVATFKNDVISKHCIDLDNVLNKISCFIGDWEPFYVQHRGFFEPINNPDSRRSGVFVMCPIYEKMQKYLGRDTFHDAETDHSSSNRSATAAAPSLPPIYSDDVLRTLRAHAESFCSSLDENIVSPSPPEDFSVLLSFGTPRLQNVPKLKNGLSLPPPPKFPTTNPMMWAHSRKKMRKVSIELHDLLSCFGAWEDVEGRLIEYFLSNNVLGTPNEIDERSSNRFVSAVDEQNSSNVQPSPKSTGSSKNSSSSSFQPQPPTSVISPSSVPINTPSPYMMMQNRVPSPQNIADQVFIPGAPGLVLSSAGGGMTSRESFGAKADESIFMRGLINRVMDVQIDLRWSLKYLICYFANILQIDPRFIILSVSNLFIPSRPQHAGGIDAPFENFLSIYTKDPDPLTEIYASICVTQDLSVSQCRLSHVSSSSSFSRGPSLSDFGKSEPSPVMSPVKMVSLSPANQQSFPSIMQPVFNLLLSPIDVAKLQGPRSRYFPTTPSSVASNLSGRGLPSVRPQHSLKDPLITDAAIIKIFNQHHESVACAFVYGFLASHTNASVGMVIERIVEQLANEMPNEISKQRSFDISKKMRLVQSDAHTLKFMNRDEIFIGLSAISSGLDTTFALRLEPITESTDLTRVHLKIFPKVNGTGWRGYAFEMPAIPGELVKDFKVRLKKFLAPSTDQIVTNPAGKWRLYRDEGATVMFLRDENVMLPNDESPVSEGGGLWEKSYMRVSASFDDPWMAFQKKGFSKRRTMLHIG